MNSPRQIFRQQPSFPPEHVVVHELALDPHAFDGAAQPTALPLAPPGTNAAPAPPTQRVALSNPDLLQKLVKDQAYRAMFDVLAEQRAQDPAKWAASMSRLLVEMRDLICSVMPDRAEGERARLRDAMDEGLMLQMLQRDAFDAAAVLSVFEAAWAAVAAMEAPVRREASRLWWDQLKAMVEGGEAGGGEDGVVSMEELIPDLFRYVNDKIEQIRRDAFCAQVELLRPLAREHAADYERRHLPNPDHTPNTRLWLLSVLRAECDGYQDGQERRATLGRRVPGLLPVVAAAARKHGWALPGGASGAQEEAKKEGEGEGEGEAQSGAVLLTPQVVRQCVLLGVVRLVCTPTTHSSLPETFRLDHHRIHAFQNTLQQHILLGIVASLCHSFDRTMPASSPPGSPARSSPTRQWLADTVERFGALLNSPVVTLPMLKEALLALLMSRARTRLGAVQPGGEEGEGGEGAGQGALQAADAAAASIVGAFDKSCEPSHRLYTTVQARIVEFVWAVLVHDEGELSRLQSAEAVPMCVLAPNTLELAHRVSAMCDLSMRAFSDIYAGLLRGLVGAQ